jgi:hypothetical protein
MYYMPNQSEQESGSSRPKDEPGVHSIDLSEPSDPRVVASRDAPPTVAEIKASIKARAETAERRLAEVRKERDRWDALVRQAVAEHAEALRLLRSLTPRGKK